jgi:RNA polymerase sigma-70 factor (ECF subfamily)
MSEPQPDWIHVVERLVAGDRMAFAQLGRLVTGYLTKLRAYDFREEWDDLRQEIVAAVVANVRAGRLRDSRALAGYVRVVTRNKFVDRLKQHLRCPADEHLPWDDETARAMAAEETDPRLRDLWRAVRDLPEEEQRVLEEVYRQGKTYEQASASVGLPLGTMKRRLRTALMALRLRLGSEVK